jgi:hypothetical protein
LTLLPNLLTTAHSPVLDQLLTLYQGGVLPHALLFTGPQGIGKLEVAKQLSLTILGPHSTGADLFIMGPQTQNSTYSIDQIRQIQSQSLCTPYEGLSRVFILDQAEALGSQPANAFLKLLEEPPAHHYFILISSKSYKLLPTLLSRLQKFSFGPLKLESLGLDLGLFDFLAGGSYKVAQTVFDYKHYLEIFVQLLPHPYIQEYVAYRDLFERLDQDEAFNFLTFFPLFEELLRDFYHHHLELTSHYRWPTLSYKLSFSYVRLAQALGELEKAYQSNMKLSSCFERFFLSLSK